MIECNGDVGGGELEPLEAAADTYYIYYILYIDSIMMGFRSRVMEPLGAAADTGDSYSIMYNI